MTGGGGVLDGRRPFTLTLEPGYGRPRHPPLPPFLHSHQVLALFHIRTYRVRDPPSRLEGRGYIRSSRGSKEARRGFRYVALIRRPFFCSCSCLATWHPVSSTPARISVEARWLPPLSALRHAIRLALKDWYEADTLGFSGP